MCILGSSSITNFSSDGHSSSGPHALGHSHPDWLELTTYPGLASTDHLTLQPRALSLSPATPILPPQRYLAGKEDYFKDKIKDKGSDERSRKHDRTGRTPIPHSS